MNKIGQLRQELGTEFVSSMYDNADKNTLLEATKNAKWVFQGSHQLENIEPHKSFILACYTAKSSLAGVMDYKDHRGCTDLDWYKEKTLGYIDNGRVMQNLHYYNKHGKIFDVCIVKRSANGWSVETTWSNGTVAFVTELYSK